jgi:cell wall-associated NlpC family hydrolase
MAALLLSLMGSVNVSANPIGDPAPLTAVSPDVGVQAAAYAKGFVGIPYRRGGSTPKTGFDCSGLINYVYRAVAEVVPPRTVALLQSWGRAVSRHELRSGDLVIFAKPRQRPSHAGVYVGDGSFVHSPATGGRVRVERLDSAYWSSQKITFRRLEL